MSGRESAVRYTLFLITVFLSAFLLFQVQPLISRFILPWFGGSPAVWTTCMLFFQVTLFCGYLYAHLLAARLTPAQQAIIHAALLICAASLLPIVPDTSFKPDAADDAMLRIILLLSVTVGLPYFALSATGPLLQSWFHRTLPGQSPYRLYALSNAGSLLALLSYPFVIEPQFATQVQAVSWSWAFVAFASCCVLCGIVMSKSARREETDNRGEAPQVIANTTLSSPPGKLLLWATFAAVPSVMLLATTNQVCTDIAVVPFLWVLPLSLYLFTFILCFESDRWYSRKLFGPLLAVFVVSTVFLLWDSAHYWNLIVSIPGQSVIYFGLLFCCCMVCHGELVRMKPEPAQLTSFYLALAAGGAMGGLFAGLLAPVLFDTLLELHFAIMATIVLAMVAVMRDENSPLYGGRLMDAWGLLAVAVVAVGWALHAQADRVTRSSVAVTRNFYGVIRVDRFADSFVMKHGQIRHGHQFADAIQRELPTTYYGRASGAGIAIEQHKRDQKKRVGVIGLGAGTLAIYAQPGDYYRLYEINPAVVDMAKAYFTYLDDCRSEADVVIADGRIALEREAPQRFDVLVLDAFSGDAIPVHLLTKECCELYLQHLNEDGILAFHITNRHLDLRPVCQGLADAYDLTMRTAFSIGQSELGTTDASWVLLSRDPESVTSLDFGRSFDIARCDRTVLWTDHWGNLLSVVSSDPYADYRRQIERQQRTMPLAAANN
ncbi:MAG: spermidine synthase [Planctomycetota bacterium]|jgi:hypothetical protein